LRKPAAKENKNNQGGDIMAIIGYLQDIRHTYPLDKSMESAFSYLSSLSEDVFADLAQAEARKVVLQDDAVFALNQSYETKPLFQAGFENHRRYIDVQYMFTGSERILVAPLRDAQPRDDYNMEKDIQFHTVSEYSTFIVHSGMACIFFSEDVHAPGLQIEGKTTVKKCVVKILFHGRCPPQQQVCETD